MSDYKFKPYQPVLVRIGGKWNADFFSHLEDWGEDLAGDKHTGYATTAGHVFEFYNILPYDGDTKHLLGTKDEPKPQWKPEPGELVAVTDSLEETWRARRFFARTETLFLCYREKGLETEGWLFCEPLRKHFNVPEEA
jgi:hypothetical protein